MADKYENTSDEVIRVGGEVVAPGSFLTVAKVLPKHRRNRIKALEADGKLKKSGRTKAEPEPEKRDKADG